MRTTREQRIGAVADYLLGKSYKEIFYKWGVRSVTVGNLVKATGHFKMRGKHKGEKPCLTLVRKSSQE
jgi:hypothetical protein